MQVCRLNTIAACLGLLFCMPEVWAADSTPAANIAESDNLDTVTVRAKRLSTDKKGEAEQYSKNVSNVYVGKEYLERYRIDAAGDILKGLNGVYNMNTRTAGGAITPNIRGVAGKGRIPVTIDGTEQTVDVWMNNYGVSDRNYVDPALFRSIAVEKSPAMTRGVKSGVGGSVSIRTIEPSDVVPEGQKWAVGFRTEFADNTIRPQYTLNQYIGKDYRTIGGATADGAGGGFDPWTNEVSGYGVILDGALNPRSKGRFKDDRTHMAVAAFKTDLTDGLAAYSYRNKGNYISGKKGESGYLNNPLNDLQRCYDNGGKTTDCRPKAAFIPNMARLFPGGKEVIGSNTETKTLLLKNNWYLPDKQKIGLQYMRTNVRFGELNPFHTMLSLGNYEYNQDNPKYRKQPPSQVPGMDSTSRSDTQKISYEWKPQGNSWVNLQADVWRVKTRSRRHQSGGPALMVGFPDISHDYWHWCINRKQQPLGTDNNCEQLINMGYFTPNSKLQDFLDNDANSGLPPEARRIQSGALQKTEVTRTGFNISNRFTLSNSLGMVVAADYQREKLDEYTRIINSDDLFNLYGMVTSLGAMAGPRSAHRSEWGVNLGFDWHPTSRLNIQAGLRYHRFRGVDDMLRRERRNRNERYAFGGASSRNTHSSSFITGVRLPYWELMDKTTSDAWRQVVAADDRLTQAQADFLNWYRKNRDPNAQNWHEGKNEPEYRQYVQPLEDRLNNLKQSFTANHGLQEDMVRGVKASGDNCIHDHECAYYRVRRRDVMMHNGKLVPDGDLPFSQAMFEQRTNNPQGLQGSFYSYLPGGRHPTDAVPLNLKDMNTCGNKPVSEACHLTEKITDAERWREPPEMRESAWAPMLAISYDLSDKSRLFLRYAQMTRFPSLYEMSAHDVAVLGNIPRPEYDVKPERSRSWEVGYSFNFAPYWSRLREGDVRLTYFNNSIKNVLDNTDDKRITQYDRKNTTGIEFQSRADIGRIFASLGMTYRLKQEVCDSSFAFSADLYRRRIPDCIEGGFGATRFYQAMQPKYSVNFDAGVRLFGEKLELGLRTIYHSGINTKQYDRLLEQGLDKVYTSTGQPYHWRPVLLADLYGRYRFGKNMSVNFSLTNLSNRYYLDPMSNVPAPGPGRTFSIGIQGKF